jgi:hypothetical protein
LDSIVRRIAPQRPFGPREPRVTAAAGRRDRGEHSAGLRVDLLDAILGELKQVLAVEGRSKPDVPTVIRDSMHAVGTWKGSILTDDLGG